ncbi:hypothetical protein ABKN59_010399 [Abortiporus biennis]
MASSDSSSLHNLVLKDDPPASNDPSAIPPSPPPGPPASSTIAKAISANMEVIPPTKEARTVVLCFDGTGDQFDADNSNVEQFFSMLKKDDRKQQVVYYQSGIGTYTSPAVMTPFLAKVGKTLDSMVAWNLNAHVMGGYEFIMQNYEAGDKICIFGFSRGAYIARALAGMLHKVGLLPPCNHNQVPFAYKMFTRTDETGWKQSTAFKKAFCVDVDIEFVGVWDTVSSVGIIPHRLPFTASNTCIKTFRHAVSLDERRAKFKANLYNRPTKLEAKLGTQPGEMPKAAVGPSPSLADVVSTGIETIEGLPEQMSQSISHDSGISFDADPAKVAKNLKKRKNKTNQRVQEARFNAEQEGHEHEETDVLEVWFAGCHCDVGGGSVANDVRHNLARIPLRWMIRQCFLANTGIQFYGPLLRTVGLDPNALYPIVQSRPAVMTVLPTVPTQPQHDRDSTAATLVDSSTPPDETSTVTIGYANQALPVGPDGQVMNPMSEEEEDLRDLMSPIYDQLSLVWGWWLLELVPMRHRVQAENNVWGGKWSVNLGHGRKIPKRTQKRGELMVHRSVKVRMELDEKLLPEGKKYVPKATWQVEPKWVD